MMNNFWNQRYSAEEYVYGEEPNLFFKQQIDQMEPGRLLLLGEGEGRNAVYAATKGWIVDAVDMSEIGKQKALQLAQNNKVMINYMIDDLRRFKPAKDYYDVVGMVFLHLDKKTSKNVHKKMIDALKPKGSIIAELFDKEQLGKSSGGPQNIDMLYSLDELKENFHHLDIKLLDKKNILLSEGKFHSGEASVIDFIGVKY